MADKTPDSAGGARKRKRPSPTIDLKATEISGEPKPTPSQESAGPQEQAATDHESERRQRASSSPARQIGGQMLAAGFAGAAIMTAALVMLWFAGMVPARYAGQPAVDSASITELNERIGKVESATARIPGDSTISEHLSAADNAMKSLGIALTALNKRSDEVAGYAADARTRAAASEKAVTELRNSVQDLSKNTSGLSPGDVDTVQRRLAALEQAVRNATTDNAARLALSAAALRDTVASGAPFSAELDRVKSLAADEKILTPLAPFAATGVPTAAELAQELRALIPALLKASGAQAPPGGFLERLQANAGKLVRIRPVDAPAGNESSAVLARIEVESAHTDISGALADLGKLDSAARAPAEDWINKAKAQQAALTAAHQFAADTARALGKR